jgi:hypothetical protein
MIAMDKSSAWNRICSPPALKYPVGTSFLLFAIAIAFSAHATHHYTEKQLDALAARVGKVFWVVTVDDQGPSFLSNPAADARSFHAEAGPFEIIEVVGRKDKNPYYRVRFESGKEGYIRPEDFREAFNVTIMTLDPQADEKKKAAEAAEEEKQRIDWIQAQPWSRAVKEAAIKRQVIPGMNRTEVKKILGDPTRVSKLKVLGNVAEEQWVYGDRSMVIFYNGLLNRVESAKKPAGQKTD